MLSFTEWIKKLRRWVIHLLETTQDKPGCCNIRDPVSSKERHSHFHGQSVFSHLKQAKMKGALAQKEPHTTYLSGFFSCLQASAQETLILFLILSSWWPLLQATTYSFLAIIGVSWLIWKGGKTALLGWERLDTLHRVLREEKEEIEHNREEEREELKALYALRGFSGDLLDQVVTKLMSDDYRLLQVMVEEELSLSLEKQEHPLKQALGSMAGVLLVMALFTLASFWGLFSLWPPLIPLLTGLCMTILTHVESKRRRLSSLSYTIWTLSLTFASAATSYFLTMWIQNR